MNRINNGTHPLGVLYVLKMNWGPIQRRRCGPLDVTISTCDNQRSSLSNPSDSIALSFISMRFLSNQLPGKSGGWISIELSLRRRFHWAFASTYSSMGESSFCFDAGIPFENETKNWTNCNLFRLLSWKLIRFYLTRTIFWFQIVLNHWSVTGHHEQWIDSIARISQCGHITCCS